MNIKIKVSKKNHWEIDVIEQIKSDIRLIKKDNPQPALLLSAGRSIFRVFSKMNLDDKNRIFNNTNLFLTDERDVPLSSDRSNLRMIKNTLFPDGIHEKIALNGVDTCTKTPEISAAKYSMILPDFVDLILIAVADDGHIASISSNSFAARDEHKKYIYLRDPNLVDSRFTIGPKVINQAKNIIILCPGVRKGLLIGKQMKQGFNPIKYPLHLLKRGLFLMDDQAFNGYIEEYCK